MLTICTWLWGKAYSETYVQRLHRGLVRNLKRPFQFVCFRDELNHRPDYQSGSGVIYSKPILDPALTEVRGCFARLRLFDPDWLSDLGLTDTIICLDLDVVITGPLDDVFDRSEDFVILQGANTSNPCPYNGSMWMLKPGAHPEVWRDFSLEAVKQIPFHSFPDDQGWLAHKIPNAAGWKAGIKGVYAFQKPGWKTGEYLPQDARIVVFPGWRDPAKFNHLSWVQRHWR